MEPESDFKKRGRLSFKSSVDDEMGNRTNATTPHDMKRWAYQNHFKFSEEFKRHERAEDASERLRGEISRSSSSLFVDLTDSPVQSKADPKCGNPSEVIDVE